MFSRSRSTIRPVELGRRLLREMDDHRSVDVQGRRIVPNHFIFHLSARDFEAMGEIESALRAELVTAATDYAHDEHYHFIGPVSVELFVDPSLKAGRLGVASQFVEPPQAAPPPIDVRGPIIPPAPVPAAPAVGAEPVAPIVSLEPEPVRIAAFDPLVPAAAGAAAAPATPPAPDIVHLVLPSGQRVVLGQGAVTIGRIPECAVALADPNVSRRHAEIRAGMPPVIADLGSTNGTKVNGLRITGEQEVRVGDIVSVGTTHLRVEAPTPNA